MNEFPTFIENPANLIDRTTQYTENIEGYVFNGADGNQIGFWTCYKNRDSSEHIHDYDEYFVVVEGQYTVIIDGKEEVV